MSACLTCAPVAEGRAGASALREYERRRARREEYARARLGRLGALLARVIEEPQSTTAWKQGGLGEVRTGERLTHHLRGSGVRALHDRRIPGHGRANIDHIAVGPAGVLVIDTKTHRGKVTTDWRGGLFAPRRTLLLIDGRDQTGLVEMVERQVAYVRKALADPTVRVSGALCFPSVKGLPLIARLRVREVVIDGPKPIAKLAAGRGPLTTEQVERIWHRLGRAFPEA